MSALSTQPSASDCTNATLKCISTSSVYSVRGLCMLAFWLPPQLQCRVSTYSSHVHFQLRIGEGNRAVSLELFIHLLSFFLAFQHYIVFAVLVSALRFIVHLHSHIVTFVNYPLFTFIMNHPMFVTAYFSIICRP